MVGRLSEMTSRDVRIEESAKSATMFTLLFLVYRFSIYVYEFRSVTTHAYTVIYLHVFGRQTNRSERETRSTFRIILSSCHNRNIRAFVYIFLNSSVLDGHHYSYDDTFVRIQTNINTWRKGEMIERERKRQKCKQNSKHKYIHICRKPAGGAYVYK